MCSLKDIAPEILIIKVGEHQFKEGLITEEKAKNLIMKAVFTIIKKEQSQWS